MTKGRLDDSEGEREQHPHDNRIPLIVAAHYKGRGHASPLRIQLLSLRVPKGREALVLVLKPLSSGVLSWALALPPLT